MINAHFVGIDENGYGPILGPLVVTLVEGEIVGDPLKDTRIDRYLFPIHIADSKKVFQRSEHSYSGGEIAAHAILDSAGIKAATLSELVIKLTGRSPRELFGGCDILLDLYKDVELPLWARFLKESRLPSFLRNLNIVLKNIKSHLIFPKQFNELVELFDNKALVDLFLFLDLLKGQPQSTVALLGKIGGMKRYMPYLQKLGIEVSNLIQEKRFISSYFVRVDGNEIRLHFIQDGDELFFPIAFSSIVGKYLRELFMYTLNRALGFDSRIPYASGYRHDKKTHELIEAIRRRFDKRIIRRCFLRSR